MSNYFRITVYHPVHNISAIMDSNGKFEKLWQFSAHLVGKGFKIIEVGTEDKFDNGNMPKAEYDNTHIILRACKSGEPEITGKCTTIKGQSYKIL